MLPGIGEARFCSPRSLMLLDSGGSVYEVRIRRHLNMRKSEEVGRFSIDCQFSNRSTEFLKEKIKGFEFWFALSRARKAIV